MIVCICCGQVSLDSQCRESINRKMSHPKRNIFENAQAQIYTLMQRDSYRRFLDSPTYHRTLSRLTPGRESISAAPTASGAGMAANFETPEGAVGGMPHYIEPVAAPAIVKYDDEPEAPKRRGRWNIVRKKRVDDKKALPYYGEENKDEEKKGKKKDEKRKEDEKKNVDNIKLEEKDEPKKEPANSDDEQETCKREVKKEKRKKRF